MKVKRDYADEYRKFQSTPTQMKRRAKRNRDRRRAEKNGQVQKGDGKDVQHAANGRRIVMSASRNRGMPERSRLPVSRRRRR